MSIPGGWYQTKGTFETCPKRGRNLLVFFGKEAESVMPLLRTTLKLNLQHPLPIDTSKPNTAHTPRKSNPLLEGIFYFYFRCFYVTLPGGFSSLVFLIIDTATTKSGLFWLIQKSFSISQQWSLTFIVCVGYVSGVPIFFSLKRMLIFSSNKPCNLSMTNTPFKLGNQK